MSNHAFTTAKPKRYYSLRSYLSFMARFKWQFAVVLTSYMVADIFLAIIPIFIGRLVGVMATSPLDRHAVIMNVIALLVCSSGHDLVWRVSELLDLKLVNPLRYRYEAVAFSQVIRKPYPYFVDKFTGKVSANINTLAQELRDLVGVIIHDYVDQVVRLVTMSAILLSINWYSGVLFIGSMAVMFLVGRKTIKNSSIYEQKLTDVRSSQTGKIVDAIANFVNVKSFHKDEAEIASVIQEEQKTIKAARQEFIWSIAFWASMSVFIRHILWPATIILNVYLFMDGRISLAQLTTLLSSILLFSNYIWEIIWNVSQFTLRLARMEEAHVYLFGNVNITKQYFQNKLLSVSKPRFETSLAIKKLHFAYPDKKDTTVLRNINLDIKHGEKIGIVGRSGSGKTTLTKLLLDYYETAADTFYLDGKPVQPAQLAQLVAYVPQDTSLFHRSIADNIAYAADHDVSRQEVIQAAKHAHADEFIQQIDDGYDALVGERGVKLSAGQRQRIAIARAFLDNKPILILDEATSALDSESEVLVQKALENLWQHKTVIAIAHRLSTLRNMDRILVMDKGAIIESGTHQELITKKGAYASLWAHQSGGFIEE